MDATESVDDDVRHLVDEGRVDDATALILERHGAEIMGVLVRLAGGEALAAEAYSLYCERVWRALPSFRFAAAVRTWAYALARRSLADARRHRRRAPHVVLAPGSRLPEVVQQARSSTRPHLRTTHKDRLQAIRAELDEDEQLLLVLRLDRAMPWDAIARVLHDDVELEGAELRRATAALRKRYERLKARLSTRFREPL